MGLSDDIPPDRPPEIGVDAILIRKKERVRHTPGRKPALSLGVFPQRTIDHLHHGLEMKRGHLAGDSRS
jgi:hypothetical protein